MELNNFDFLKLLEQLLFKHSFESVFGFLVVYKCLSNKLKAIMTQATTGNINRTFMNSGENRLQPQSHFWKK